MLDKYIEEIKKEILCLQNKDFIGSITIEVNIKFGQIVNVNLMPKRSLRIATE